MAHSLARISSSCLGEDGGGGGGCVCVCVGGGGGGGRGWRGQR